MTGSDGRSADPRSAGERSRLAARLSAAVDQLRDPGSPVLAVDLDAFDANAADLVRRAAGTPIRVASKSLRIPALIERALGVDGISGVLGYSLREALWLVREGIAADVLVAYPTVDRPALSGLARDERAASSITLMVDDRAHLDLIDTCRDVSQTPIRVAIDIDAGLRLGPAHLGPKRSPLREPGEIASLAREIADRPGFALVGVMTYEGQVAGVPDQVPGQRARSAVVRRVKSASLAQLAERRSQIAAEIARVAALEFWNAGGSGSLESTGADPVVTELSAGSGLLGPTLFDHYAAFRPLPAAFFGMPVTRKPGPGIATVAGGGYIASGPPGEDRMPVPWAPPGLRLTRLEGAGEVQTPIAGPGADKLALADWVWFRHAKAGELAEHGNTVHLLHGADVDASVPTYRGCGCAW